MAPLCLCRECPTYLGPLYTLGWSLHLGFLSGDCPPCHHEESLDMLRTQTLRKKSLTETSLMATADTPSLWAGRRATWVRWSRSHRMHVQSCEPLTKRLKVTDAARHVTACVCPYKAWGQGVKVQVMRGALNPVTQGDTPLSPFTVGPQMREQRFRVV